jgi:hypothetical protein
MLEMLRINKYIVTVAWEKKQTCFNVFKIILVNLLYSEWILSQNHP